jgi:hypothetical protein
MQSSVSTGDRVPRCCALSDGTSMDCFLTAEPVKEQFAYRMSCALLATFVGTLLFVTGQKSLFLELLRGLRLSSGTKKSLTPLANEHETSISCDRAQRITGTNISNNHGFSRDDRNVCFNRF